LSHGRTVYGVPAVWQQVGDGGSNFPWRQGRT
jgi:hypothetical protein